MRPPSEMRKPYRGPVRALVLALDVGTTFSGVSYAILEPGEVPKIHGVTRFPGQEHVAGNSKIPTVMWYDHEGNMIAAGAEAELPSMIAEAEDNQYTKAELFKLRLRPRTMRLQMNGMAFSPLPRGRSAVDVFGDFLRYMHDCTRIFISDTHASGKQLWDAVAPSCRFVLSHPNGWEGAQQSKMRRAAVGGGLIEDTDEGRSRIYFVTEGEASLHACVQNGLAAEVLSDPTTPGFVVADAGGGTLDISSYAIRGTNPLVIEEIAPPDCIFAGSVFVSRRAKAFFQERLARSRFGAPDSIEYITKRFDETTKRLFRDSNEVMYVAFGTPLDKDPSVDIRSGQLKLAGQDVAGMFEESVQAAVRAIEAQVRTAKGQIKSVWLVGGFAASPWLFHQLGERLKPLGLAVARPDNQTSKAVADGAVGFYCDHHVSARMAKFMYGVEYLREYDANDSDHVSRKDRLCELPSGPKLLLDAFDCILARNVRVKESTVFSRKYCTELTSLSTLSVFEVEIWCFRGGDTVPKWIERHSEVFSTLCLVRADLSPLTATAVSKAGKSGKKFWTIVFSIEIHFGLTEFKARIKWIDTDGKTRYGPASIIYNESGSRANEEEPDAIPEDDPRSRPSTRLPSGVPSRTHSRDIVPTQRSLAPTARSSASASASASVHGSSGGRTPSAQSRNSLDSMYLPHTNPRTRTPSASRTAGTVQSSVASSRVPSAMGSGLTTPVSGSRAPSYAPSAVSMSRTPSGNESTSVAGVPLDITPAAPSNSTSRRTSYYQQAPPPGQAVPVVSASGTASSAMRSRKESLKSVTFSESDRNRLRETMAPSEQSGAPPPAPSWYGEPNAMSRSESHSSAIANNLDAVWSPQGQTQPSVAGSQYAPSRTVSRGQSTYSSAPRESSRLGTSAYNSRAPSAYGRPPSPGSAAHLAGAPLVSSSGTHGHATPRAASPGVRYAHDGEVVVPNPPLHEIPAHEVVPPGSFTYDSPAHEQGGWGGVPGGFNTPAHETPTHPAQRVPPPTSGAMDEQSLDDILAGAPSAGSAQSGGLFGAGGWGSTASGFLSDVLSKPGSTFGGAATTASAAASQYLSTPTGTRPPTRAPTTAGTRQTSKAPSPRSRAVEIPLAAEEPAPPPAPEPEPLVAPAKGKKGKKGKKTDPVTPAFEEPEPTFEPPREPTPEPIIVAPAEAPAPEPTPAEEKQEDEWFAPTVTKGKKGKKGKKGALAEPEPEPEPAPPAPPVEEYAEAAAPEPEPAHVEETKPAEDEWFTPAATTVKKGKKGKKNAAFGWDQAEEPAAEPAPPAPIEPEPAVEPVVEEKAPAPEPTMAADEDLFAPAIKKGKKNQKKSPWGAAAADPEPEPTVAARPETAPPAKQEPPPAPAVNEMHSEEPSNAAGGTDDGFSSAQARKDKKSGKTSTWGTPNPEPAAPELPKATSPPAVSPGANEENGGGDWFGGLAKKSKITSAKSWLWGGGAAEPEPEPVVATPAVTTPPTDGNDWFANAAARKAKKEGVSKTNSVAADNFWETPAGGASAPGGWGEPEDTAGTAHDEAPLAADPVTLAPEAPAVSTNATPMETPAETPGEEKEDDWFASMAKPKKGKKGKKGNDPGWDDEGDKKDDEKKEEPSAPAEPAPEAEPEKKKDEEDDWFKPTAAKGKKGKKGKK